MINIVEQEEVAAPVIAKTAEEQVVIDKINERHNALFTASTKGQETQAMVNGALFDLHTALTVAINDTDVTLKLLDVMIAEYPIEPFVTVEDVKDLAELHNVMSAARVKLKSQRDFCTAAGVPEL